MQYPAITAILALSIVSSHAESLKDSWTPWRQTAIQKAKDEIITIKKGNIYSLNLAEKESFSGFSGRLEVLNEDGKTFFRINPESERTVFSYRLDSEIEAFQLSFLFRVGDVSKSLVSGEGALADIQFHNGGRSFGLTLQAAYVNNGTWFLNGLKLREDGKQKKIEKESAVSAAVLRQGPSVDCKWHSLKIQSAPPRMRILFDNSEVFYAEDPALAFIRMVVVFHCPTRKLKWADFSDIQIDKIEFSK